MKKYVIKRIDLERILKAGNLIGYENNKGLLKIIKKTLSSDEVVAVLRSTK